MGLFSGIGKAIGSVVGAVSGSPLLGAGASLLGGVLTNNANSAEAAANRNFQADQTGTAYQRAVADLKAAGLNPMLAYTNGGASSGGGAQAVMQNAIGGAVNTAMAARMNSAQVDNLTEQNKQIKSQTALNTALIAKAAADARLSNNSADSVATNNDIKSPAASVSRGIQPFINSASDALRNNAQPVINRLNSLYEKAKNFNRDGPTMDDLLRVIQESKQSK